MTTVDQPARDLIRTALDRNLFVEAGAGTGKTTALVSRLVQIVIEGQPIQGVAAITFTENAAAELRQRIRTALSAEADKAELPEPKRALCRAALDELDDSAITTLHGFAQRLLADHPLEAGLPVGFGVQDDIRASLERDRWWAAAVDDTLNDPELQPIWRVALALDLAPDALRSIADKLQQGWDLLDPDAVPPTDQVSWQMDDILAPLRRAATFADSAPPEDTLGAYLRTDLPSLLAALDVEQNDLGRASVLHRRTIPTSKGNAQVLTRAGLDKAEIVGHLKEAREAWDGQLATAQSVVLLRLVAWLRTAVLADVARRRREGTLHFHDLLVLARDLLASSSSACAHLHDRWPVLLVDEFQDTDPLQVEIVHLLAAGVPGTWHEIPLDGGTLFFVGDPKQSIYRFRRADIEIFREVQARSAAENRPALIQNFRSRPLVLDVVNTAMRTLMDKPDQVPYVELAAERSAVPEDPGPTVLLLGEPHAENMPFVREREAEHLAATCHRVVAEQWRVGERTAKYDDIAVIVPTRTSLSALEKQLQAQDVPYRIESRSLIWETDAVRELLAVMEAIADPRDQVAVVTALRSAGFGCTDPDLAGWYAAGGGWDYRLKGPEHPVAEAMAALHRYHDQRWWLPVNQLVDLVIRERRLVELTAGLNRPRDHWRRLRFVADQARSFLDSGGAQLGDFVRWARQQADSGADAIETVVPEPDDQAVRILTIHAAKGLEFPVTIVAGINVDESVREEVLFAGGEIEARKKGFTTPGWTAALAAEKSQQAAEAVRLLYVALTRAEDHLVVSLHHKEKTKSNHAARLQALLQELVAVGAAQELTCPAPSPIAPTQHQGPVPDLQARTDFMTERAALLERVNRSVPVTASSLPGDEPADELALADAVVELVDEPVAFRVPVTAGATLGSAVHRLLELVDFADWSPDGVEKLSHAVAAELGAPQLAAEAARRAQHALRHPLLAEAGQCWKEVPISAPVGERRVEGYIDLVLRTPEGLVVVDYKTDGVSSPTDVAEKVAHYGPQLRGYAAALASATGLPVVAAQLLFVGPHGCTTACVPMD